MKQNNKPMSNKEKYFCLCYAESGNVSDAASRAGYRRPEKDGAVLMTREDIIGQIEKLCKLRAGNARERARIGYERIAFGNVSDAVSLLFDADPAARDLNSCDLFNVAEIKRPKEGALEIKFFDRIKALEKLEGFDEEEHRQKNPVSEFYQALVSGLQQKTCGKEDDADE